MENENVSMLRGAEEKLRTFRSPPYLGTANSKPIKIKQKNLGKIPLPNLKQDNNLKYISISSQPDSPTHPLECEPRQSRSSQSLVLPPTMMAASIICNIIITIIILNIIIIIINIIIIIIINIIIINIIIILIY